MIGVRALAPRIQLHRRRYPALQQAECPAWGAPSKRVLHLCNNAVFVVVTCAMLPRSA